MPAAPGPRREIPARARSRRSPSGWAGAAGAERARGGGDGAGRGARDGGLATCVGAGTGAPRPEVVSVGTAGGGAWLTRTVSRDGGGADTLGVSHARQGASHQSAAAIATPPRPPTPHQRREPGRA